MVIHWWVSHHYVNIQIWNNYIKQLLLLPSIRVDYNSQLGSYRLYQHSWWLPWTIQNILRLWSGLALSHADSQHLCRAPGMILLPHWDQHSESWSAGKESAMVLWGKWGIFLLCCGFNFSYSETTSEIFFGAFRVIIKKLLGRDQVWGNVYQKWLPGKALIQQEGGFDTIYWNLRSKTELRILKQIFFFFTIVFGFGIQRYKNNWFPYK